MCSILGYYKLTKKSVPDKTFAIMAMDLMRHRGPDAESFREFDKTAGLGGQRLSIIDTRNVANQPIEDKKSAIVFNGEIYNYLELRETLLQKIYFKTTSDTEVLQKGLEKFGPKFLNKTNGMFAFALYDKKKRTLMLSRDRFGVKPCHYMLQDGVLYFSSEMKPLIEIKRELKRNNKIYNSFFGDTATDYDQNTFVKGIFQIRPGHYLYCKGRKVIERKWYFGNDFNFDKSIFGDKCSTVYFFEDLLVDAISKRLRSDVPVSLTLSAGLDSSTIYTLLKERLNAKVTLFTFVNDKSKMSELSNVKRLVTEYGDKLNEVRSNLKVGATLVKNVLRSLEFPTWDISAIAYLAIYSAIHKRGFKVVIEGHGSDEQLGGYPYMIESAVAESLMGGKVVKAFKLTKILLETEMFDKAKIGARPILNRLLYISNKMLFDKSFAGNFKQGMDDAFDYRILPIVLRTFDRLTMARSVESRSPFMDYRIVEFLRKMPMDYKVSEIGSKALLREILRKYRKDFIYKDKRKVGFGLDLSLYNTAEFSDWKSSSTGYLDRFYGLKK